MSSAVAHKINLKCKMENKVNSNDLHFPWDFKNKFLKIFLSQERP